MRRLLFALLVPLLVLSACADETAKEPDPASPDIAAIKVTGVEGKAPEVTGVKGFTTTKIVSSVASEGTGESVADGDTINLSYVLYAGKDGSAVTSTYDSGAPVALTLDQAKDKLLAGSLLDKKIGSRVVIAAPAVEFYGQENAASAGVANEDTLVLVTELVSKFVAPKVTGTLTDVKVDGAFGKEPKVTAKKGLVVAKTEAKVLKRGAGAVVKEGAKVSVRYIGVDGRTGKTFDSSYSTGKTADLTLDTSSVIPGFVTGLVGQKLGSRVLVTIPYTDGYGPAGNPQAGINGGDSLIFVVDLVKVAG